MLKIICFTLRVDKGHISPYCKNITELYIRVRAADRRVKTLLHVNRLLLYTLHAYILDAERCFERDIGWSE